MDRKPEHSQFWEIAGHLIAHGDVEEGTMMGHHCLRATRGGGFVATVERSSGDLVVNSRSPGAGVDRRTRRSTGCSCRPGLSEWVVVPKDGANDWEALIVESTAFVSGLTGRRQRRIELSARPRAQSSASATSLSQ